MMMLSTSNSRNHRFSMFSRTTTTTSTQHQHQQGSSSLLLLKSEFVNASFRTKGRSNTTHQSLIQSKQHQHHQQVQVQIQAAIRPHPHAGARDELGRWGYIHDPTFVKHHPLPFTYDLNDGQPAICATRFGLGEEGFDGFLGLEKINITHHHHHHTVIRNKQSENSVSSLPRILCIVYTHSNRHDMLVQAIVETYATHCDGFMAASNQTNRTIGAVDLPHAGPESYTEMWNKVRSIWSYVYDHYRHDYDYFHLNGDDTYVIAENLRYYVSTLSPSSSPSSSSSSFQYLGAIMADYKPRRTYCGGGGGYTLNRATLELLVRDILPLCGSNFTSPQEDFIVGICFLRHNRTLRCGDTRDEDGATRYHQSTAEWQVQWNGGKANVMRNDILMEKYNFQYKSRLDGISRTSISFHLKHPNVHYIQRTMRRYHAILYPEVCTQQQQSKPKQ